LADDPVVARLLEQVAKQGVGSAGESIEDPQPVLPGHVVCEPLCARGALQRHEGVVDTLVCEVVAVHLVGEPVVAVEVDLDLEGEPGLDLHVHQTELTVEEIETEVEARSLSGDEPGLGFGIDKAIGPARLDPREDTDQALADPVFLGDGASLLVHTQATA
jgi:hypothetical protein